MSLKPFDLVVMLQFALNERLTMAELGVVLHTSEPEIRRALKRADRSHLYAAERHAVNRLAFVDFLVHAVYYVFPAEARRVKPRCGVPTAWSAPPLSRRILAYDDDVAIWPRAGGPVTGTSVIKPLDPRAVAIAERDPKMHELLALVDAIRAGRAREKALGKEAITERIRADGRPTSE